MTDRADNRNSGASANGRAAAAQAPNEPAAQRTPSAPPSWLVGVAEAARLCGVSRATWDRLEAAGRVGPAPVRLGGRVLYRRAELEEWTAAGCPDRRTWAALRAAQQSGRRS